MGRENMHLVQNQGLDARSRLTISFRVVLHPLSSRAQEVIAALTNGMYDKENVFKTANMMSTIRRTEALSAALVEAGFERQIIIAPFPRGPNKYIKERTVENSELFLINKGKCEFVAIQLHNKGVISTSDNIKVVRMTQLLPNLQQEDISACGVNLKLEARHLLYQNITDLCNNKDINSDYDTRADLQRFYAQN